MLEDLQGREPLVYVHQQHHGDELLPKGTCNAIGPTFKVTIGPWANAGLLF